jgi:serine/threonine protein kinase
MDQRKNDLDQALFRLMSPPRPRNIDYLRHFYSLYSLDGPYCQQLNLNLDPIEEVVQKDLRVVEDQPIEIPIELELDQLYSTGEEFGRGKVGVTYKLGIRNRPNRNLILKEIKNVEFRDYLSMSVNVFSDQEGKEKIDFYWKYFPFISTEGMHLIIGARSDNFSTQTAVSSILNLILGAYGNRNFVYQYDAFFCSEKADPKGLPAGKIATPGKVDGYSILELATDGDLSVYFDRKQRLTTDQVDDVLTQILTPMKILASSDYFFVHGDLKAKNVFVSRKSDGSPLFKLADFDKSSITWNGVRFYNVGRFGVEKIRGLIERIKQIYPDRFRITIDGDQDVYYQIPEKGIVELAIRHSPIPFYSSYDLYTFFLSLMMEPVFYSWYLESKKRGQTKFDRLWRWIWSFQLQRIDQIIAQQHQNLNSLKTGAEKKKELTKMRSIAYYNTILQGIYLRVDLAPVFDLYQIPALRSVPILELAPGFFRDPILISTQNEKMCLTPCSTYTFSKDLDGYQDTQDAQDAIGNLITFDETGYVSRILAPDQIKACRTYPYRSYNRPYTWDHC